MKPLMPRSVELKLEVQLAGGWMCSGANSPANAPIVVVQCSYGIWEGLQH